MSDTTGRTDPVPVVRFVEGETPQMTQLAAQLGRLLHADGLAHLVLYDGDTATVVLDASGKPVPETHPHERAGRRLYYILEELEPDFTALRTGALIRTVLRVPTGAVLFYLVEPGFHLYGATTAVERLDELDARMAECVNQLRLPVRYSPLNFGAWFNDEPWTRPPGTRPADPGSLAAATLPTGPYLAENHPDASAPPAPVREALRSALGVHGLHGIAYHRSPTTAWTYDIFDHPALEAFFRVQSPARRRGHYRRMGQLLPGITSRMNLSLGALLRGELMQVVLDVEQGAVYFHALPGGSFLMGVTLDQSRVSEADQRIARLGRELSKG